MDALGPTADDLTREAAAAAAGRLLRRDPAIVEALRARFARYGRAMSATNEKQADVLEGTLALANSRGTAPGQLLEHEGRVLVLLPGPPGEMKPMFDEQVLARLRARAGTTRVVRRRVLRIAAMPESEVDEIAAPVYSRFENPKTTILGAVGQVELHLVAHGDGAFEADSRIEELAVALRAALPGRIYAEDGRDLPQVVVGLLRERGLTLALAESCTGGLLSARVTDVPGASGAPRRPERPGHRRRGRGGGPVGDPDRAAVHSGHRCRRLPPLPRDGHRQALAGAGSRASSRRLGHHGRRRGGRGLRAPAAARVSRRVAGRVAR